MSGNRAERVAGWLRVILWLIVAGGCAVAIGGALLAMQGCVSPTLHVSFDKHYDDKPTGDDAETAIEDAFKE